MQINYTLLFVGQVPVFSRPKEGEGLYHYRMSPGRPRTSWKLVQNAWPPKARTPTLRWARIKPEEKGNLNFVARFQDMHVAAFVPYIRHAASQVPDPRPTGALEVVLCPAGMHVDRSEPEWIMFALLYTSLAVFSEPPPQELTRICPRQI